MRVVEATDAPGIAEIYDPVVQNTVISFELLSPSATEFARRICTTIATHPWLVCEDGAQIGGYAYATPHRPREAYRWSTEVSVYVHPDFQRRGIARALYTALFQILARQGFVRALAGVALPNDASVHLHQSLGFEAAGVLKKVGFKFASWHDVAWWQRALTEAAHNPDPPTPFGEVLGAAWVDDILEETGGLIKPSP